VLIDHYDALLDDVERDLIDTAKLDDLQAYYHQQTIGGVGKTLALVLLNEIHEIRRFADVGHFLSYARLVRCAHESGRRARAARRSATSLALGLRRGGVHDAASQRTGQAVAAAKEKKRGKAKRMSILAAKLGRAVSAFCSRPFP
jgi:transposase